MYMSSYLFVTRTYHSKLIKISLIFFHISKELYNFNFFFYVFNPIFFSDFPNFKRSQSRWTNRICYRHFLTSSLQLSLPPCFLTFLTSSFLSLFNSPYFLASSPCRTFDGYMYISLVKYLVAKYYYETHEIGTTFL